MLTFVVVRESKRPGVCTEGRHPSLEKQKGTKEGEEKVAILPKPCWGKVVQVEARKFKNLPYAIYFL